MGEKCVSVGVHRRETLCVCMGVYLCVCVSVCVAVQVCVPFCVTLSEYTHMCLRVYMNVYVQGVSL